MELNDAGELVINFEFRPDRKQEQSWREYRNAEAVETVLKTLDGMSGMDGYITVLKTKSPTDKDKNRPLLAKYINQYTARNTYDYFIHKDLNGFLRRELDFYIKNEVMRLDDIENADAPAVETYLSKIKVLRGIARKLIDFLAQLENFQKKLWLKKKFVVETNYCITLDHVPEGLYAEIAANEAQRQEWVRLFAIDEIKGDMHTPPYSEPLTVEFLMANPFLVLDTKFFDDGFTARLIASIGNFDEFCDGVMIHSENFQALNFLRMKHNKSIRYVYIDPPYNTDSTPIIYKNEYRHSSWVSLLYDRISVSMQLMTNDGVKTIAIDDTEMVNLSKIVEGIAPGYRLSRITVVHNPKGSITSVFNRVHEYSLFLTPEKEKNCITRTLEENETPRKMRRWGAYSLRTDRRLSFYPIYVKDNKITRIGSVPADDFSPSGKNVATSTGEIEIWPIDQDGIERRWNFGLDSIEANLQRIIVLQVDETLDLFVTHEQTVPKTVWTGGEYDAGNYGNTLLINLLGNKQFDFPKSIHLVKRCIHLVTTEDSNSTILDYFAGSGTTGHAVINLNREDNGKRKYILIEMGNYFNEVIRPRIQKVTYSTDWKDGKPKNRNTGISHCFKYLRLESYEDALNNLSFDQDPARDKAISGNPELREDYRLNYMLDVESRGSQSLLNIDAFADPTAYTLRIKKPGSNEYDIKAVDLMETFNYLIGLRVNHIAAPQSFTASFKQERDPELPEDQNTRLLIDGDIKPGKNGPWWFRKVEGWVPTDRNNPNNGQREKVLIIWRKLTGDIVQDNAVLDAWFENNRNNTPDFKFDTIYVNGSNNLANLMPECGRWTVHLIEEDFMRHLWDVEG
ncbi:MAG: site-specific DNA-methyltransferase [Nitrospirae bacterium]|nr:site-specific DNA-methyltransferase [Nitrospirota bacterium]